MQDHRYILLLAGGSGTRLFPASRENKPKHLSKIVGDTTLFQQTLNRAVKIVPKKNIFVSTNVKYVDQVQKQAPFLTREQIIDEPEKKNTAPAFALGTTIIARRDPLALIAALSCDHQVLLENNFVSAIKTGFDAVSRIPDAVLTVAIQPTSPQLGFEYVEKDGLVWKSAGHQIFKVKRLIERPSERVKAQQFIDAGYFWNASYYVFAANHFLDEVKRLLPAVYRGVSKKTWRQEWHKLPEAQVDKTVMTQTTKLLVLPVDLGWMDIGSWETVISLIEEKKKDEDGNFSDGKFVGIDTHNTIIFNENPERLVATIGLNNISVVVKDDVVLIMERGRGQEVRKVIDEIKKRKLDKFL